MSAILHGIVIHDKTLDKKENRSYFLINRSVNYFEMSHNSPIHHRKEVIYLLSEEKTKSKILASAVKLFGERGKDGVSTGEIARDAQVNKALIFYHFKTKDELYRTVFKSVMNEFVENVHGKMSGGEPGLPAVEAFVRSHIQALEDNKHMANMMIRELLFSDAKESTAIRRDFAEVFKTLRNDILRALSSAGASGQIRAVDPIQTIVSIVSLDVFFFLGKPLVQMINQSVDLDVFESDRIDHVVDILMNGLRKNQE